MRKSAALFLGLLLLAGNSWGESVKLNAYGPGVHMDQFGRPVTLQPTYGNSTIPPAKSGGALALFEAWQQQKARNAAEAEDEAGRNWLINYQTAQSPEERILRRQQLPNVVKNVEKIIFLNNFADRPDQHRAMLEAEKENDLNAIGKQAK